MNHRFSRRTRLLTGVGAAFALLGPPALAQTTEAGAPRSAINEQSTGAPITVDIDRASMAEQVGTVRVGDASVAANSILASARANAAATTLDGDEVTSAAAAPSSLSVAGPGVTADADRLVENGQTMTDATVQSLALRSEVGIDAGAVSSATLGVTDNTIEASAVGSQASDSLSLANGGAGGAIVSMQTGDSGSGVSALDTDAVRLSAGAGANSRLDLSGNQVGADATGNRVDDALSIQAGPVRAPATGSPASLASASGSDAASVDALYADLGSQSMSGNVAATVGLVPASIAFGVTGGLTGSSATVQDNALSASATANRSSHALDLKAAGIAGDGAASGAATIANITNVQRDQGNNLVAATNGGTLADVGGVVLGSTLDVSQNAQTATAVANRATGNLLTVEAATIDTGEPSGPGLGVVGTALTGADGAARTTAPFGVQNVQATNGASVIATMTANRVGVDLGGTVDRSTIAADANTAASAATANIAVNGVTLDGGSVRSGIAVSNSQTVDGQLRSNVGDAADRAGVTISLAAGVAGSTLSIIGNSLTGASVGNDASNSLAVSAATLGNGGGHDQAVAGSLDNGYGASADMALSNYQRLGQPVAAGGTPSGLATTVIGTFGVGGSGATRASQLDVSGNSQSATSVGNTAIDRLSLEAATMPEAGSALTSSQFGEGTIVATSDMQITGRAGLDTSSLSMTGNTNQATAAMNDADNGLAVSAAQIGSIPGGTARAVVGNLGTATIAGDHVLANEQFAAGSVAATARTSVLDADAGAGMAGSVFDLAGDGAVADASANHASNTVSTSGANVGANAGLASSQMNAATVTAASDLETALAPAGAAPAAIRGSTATIDGNLVQAIARGNSVANEVTVSTGNAPAVGAPTVMLGAFETDASAPALLVNRQSNYGAVTARATSNVGGPLDAPGSVSSSMLGVSGNSAVASAYGNAATNTLTVGGTGAPSAMLVNVQSNNAPVAASVIGSTTGMRTGALTASTMALTGNQLAATAIGNLATGAVSTAR